MSVLFSFFFEKETAFMSSSVQPGTQFLEPAATGAWGALDFVIFKQPSVRGYRQSNILPQHNVHYT
jgi:hypothetical protein